MSLGGGSSSNVAQESLRQGQAGLSTASTALASNATAGTDFATQFYSQYIQPMIGRVTSATDNSQTQNTQTYAAAQEQTAQAKDLATNTGVPLIKSYADQVSNFSSKAYADQQAQLAIGDVNSQQQTSDQTQQRQQAAAGINASSGSSQAVKSQSDVSFAVAKAAAASRARALADQQALSVGSSGANLGVQLQAAPGAALATQSAITGQGAAIPAQNLGAVTGATQAVYPGYQNATTAESSVASSNADVAGRSAEAAQKAQSADQSGMGQLIGTGLSIAASFL